MLQRIILPDGTLPPLGPFPHAVRAGDFLFVTGQLAEDPETGEVVAGSIDQQVKRVMNISIPNRDLHLTPTPNIDTIAHSTTQGVSYSRENRYNLNLVLEHAKNQLKSSSHGPNLHHRLAVLTDGE